MRKNGVSTIRDVARDAGVAIATVSRTLNEPWRVRPETQERVLASVRKLNYRPNYRARLLARGDSGTFCFLLSNRVFGHPVHSGVLLGAIGRAEELGRQIVCATASYGIDTPSEQVKLPQILGARGLVDGVILAGGNHPNILPAIEQLELPYVVCAAEFFTDSEEKLPNAVYVDDYNGGLQVGRHLIELGHKKIGFIGDLKAPHYKHRFLGCKAACDEAGVELTAVESNGLLGRLKMGQEAVQRLCKEGFEFTALFSADDKAALGAIRALRDCGLTYPDDVSIVGFGDEPLAIILTPTLTTVGIPTVEVGAACVDMLQSIIKEGKPEQPVTLPVQLLARESTARVEHRATRQPATVRR